MRRGPWATALPACSPHSDGDARAAVAVSLVLTGPAPHDDVPVLQFLRSLCRQPGATLPAGRGEAAMRPGRNLGAATEPGALCWRTNTSWCIIWKKLSKTWGDGQVPEINIGRGKRAEKSQAPSQEVKITPFLLLDDMWGSS